MTLRVRVHDSIAGVGREAWDACAAATGDPFLSYDFLHACEASGSAVPSQGWGPRHLALEGDDGAVIGVMPLYLKGHSQGEYVFDHAWADAYERAGGRYYPKLLSAVPFTPATGPRLLARPDADAGVVREALLQGAVGLAEQAGVSSLHVNFPTREEWTGLGDAGLLLRQDIQFIWRNGGYASFDDFLAALSSSRRKTIRRERREAQAGLEIRVLTGGEIEEAHWDAFFAFYMDTGSRKWGRPYLTRDFFSRVGATMADRIALVMSFRAGQAIAGALNFIGRDALYGRQWGSLDDVPFLHFELCYYQAIDFAIARGLSRVEAGAQGEHKLARGYLPSAVYSAHWIAHDGLRAAVSDYLERERTGIDLEIEAMTAEMSPYKAV
ncbi:N-acetyltransferase [Brevundimonas sp. S30B]|uniref:GNAT family N-acetyltransferase n=1 Tax=unclassified Brevundimonas TaxID=2622653 RepID=UPI001071E826|nr:MULTISPECIES: GNAT family N-acetyltransferase [unclassified Brevundimonas]QBX38062.1 N-acetyltransferase [Brevundimonas sp. MF30-B]TFW02584.1 N-acetyltransferase [Brevundimonas sp. S30B]